MKFSLLEPITCSKNSSNPQFTPFNYIMERNNYKINSDMMNAIFLSQLPVIFKKYNIPLCENDLLLWLNSKDNIADAWDFEDIIGRYDTATYEEKKEIEFVQEVFDFFGKIIDKINYKNRDKLIEELINKRYNYYYNRHDKNAYYKFIKFLNFSIKDGFIPYKEVDVGQDFTMNKKEQIEQKIREHFYSIKETFQDKTIVFLSERYQKVYEILVKKYPEIEFSTYYSSEDYRVLNRSIDAIFINDINYELVPKMKIRNYVPRLNLAPMDYHQLPENFIPNHLPIHPAVPPYLQTDVSLNEQVRINKGKKYFRYCRITDITEVIDYLEAERKILIENGITSTIHMLPNAFQEYFIFSMENECFISYFKTQLNSKTLTPEPKKMAIKSLLNNFDISVIPEKTIEILLTASESTPLFKHDSIMKEPILQKDGKKYFLC